MSDPHPAIAISMLKEMLNRIDDGKIKYFIGDVVSICDTTSKDTFTTKIRFPYCYDIEGEQSYCVEDNALPWKDSEIKLIKTMEGNKEKTISFFNEYISKKQKELDEGTYVPA